MADTQTGLYTKPKKVAQNKKNPSKLYSHFLFKAVIFMLFLVIIPLFPSSEAPDSVKPSIFARWWELLHLIFVGIAVSYGLFSRKNDDDSDTQVINNSKFDTAQSYMSKLLHVPSVFDDDVNSPTGSHDHNSNDNISSGDNKVQTWSSQYHRNEPVLVVANDSNKSTGVGNIPLLLPVRSLKSRVLDSNEVEFDSRVYARSSSSHDLKELSYDSRRIGMNDVKLVDEADSRGFTRSNYSVGGKGLMSDSNRINRKDSGKFRGVVRNGDGEGSRSSSRTDSNSNSRGYSRISRRTSGGDYRGLKDGDVEECKEKVEESVVLPSPIPWKSRSGRMEVNKESFDSSSYSLPPSLEESGAAQLLRSQSSFSSRSSSSCSSPKELSPSPSLSSPRRISPSPSASSESLAKSVEDDGRRKLVYSSHLAPPPPPPPPPSHRSQFGKSSSSKNNEDISSSRKDLKKSIWSEPRDIGIWSEPRDIGRGNREEPLNRINSGLEARARNGIDNSSGRKSVRTVRAGEMMSSWKTGEIEEENRRSEDSGSDVTEKPEHKTAGHNTISKASFSEYPKETRDFLEQVLVGSDDDSESEDDNYVEEPVETAKVEDAPSESADEGPDVDKKADEFIAKFREQIRLQRIESIKRTAGQLKRSSLR